jgi:hypothetical protein
VYPGLPLSHSRLLGATPVSNAASVTIKIDAHFFDEDGKEVGRDSGRNQRLDMQGEYLLTFSDNLKVALVRIGNFD